MVVASATVLASQARLRWDATSETDPLAFARNPARCCGDLDPRQPVFIQAYFSPDVPRAYVDARNTLSAMLREFDAAGGEAVHVRIIETVKYSPQAREALERFNIRPVPCPGHRRERRASTRSSSASRSRAAPRSS